MKPKEIEKALSDVARRLKELRIQKGFKTAEDFCTKYGLPKMQYWKMENAKTTFTLTALLRVLVIYELSLEDFFCIDYKKAAA
jgi:transcriptional regulator with XRE-family HTH domain